MANIKTAISIEKPIFEQMNVLAKDLNISRSQVVYLHWPLKNSYSVIKISSYFNYLIKRTMTCLNLNQ